VYKAHRTPVKVGPRWDGKASILDGVNEFADPKSFQTAQPTGRRRLLRATCGGKL